MDYIKTWKEVILRPSDFYRRMPMTGGYSDPLTFAAISFIIRGIFSVLFRSRILTLVCMHDWIYNSSIFSTVIITPIESILGLFIIALIFNLLYHLKALGGAGSYEGTVRFISYASAPTVFSWIPVIGLIFVVYHYYLYIVGGKIVQNVSMKKSTIVVFLISLPFMFFEVRAILSTLVF